MTDPKWLRDDKTLWQLYDLTRPSHSSYEEWIDDLRALQRAHAYIDELRAALADLEASTREDRTHEQDLMRALRYWHDRSAQVEAELEQLRLSLAPPKKELQALRNPGTTYTEATMLALQDLRPKAPDLPCKEDDDL